MTLQEFQDALHLAYQGDTDTPATSDDEWDVRQGLLKAAINAWNSAKGTLWLELWQEHSTSGILLANRTINASDVDYDCYTDFLFPGGFVRITNSAGQHTYVKVIQPNAAQLDLNASTQKCYFTGNKRVGFSVHFLFQPTAGDLLNFPYYKEPFIPTSASHVIEMSDPYFAVEHALAKLHETDGEGDRATLALAKATEKLDAMKTKNTMPAWFQENSVPDQQFTLGVGGFGT